MSKYQQFNGISLVPGSAIEDLNAEQLSVDPSPIVAGRIWYNTTDKVMRLSSLDVNGAIVVQTFATVSELAALKLVVDQVNGDATVAGSFRSEIQALIGGAPDALNTLIEISNAINADQNIADTLTQLMDSKIATMKESVVSGATAAMDTLGEVQAAINNIVADMGDVANLTTSYKSDLVGAINEVAGVAEGAASDLASYRQTVDQAIVDANKALTDYETAQGIVTGDITTLTTTDHSSLTAAINELKSEAGAGAAALMGKINGKVYTYDSITAKAVHSEIHGLSGDFLNVNAMMLDPATSKWINTQVLTSLDSVTKSFSMSMFQAAQVRLSVQEMDALV